MENTRILHLDMDAYFASVEILDQPDLRGKPVLVGGTGPRSVVAACSYEARRFGIHSAMPMRRAQSRCPEAIILPPRMARYRELSRAIFSWIGQQAPLLEKVSVDEAYIDITFLETDEKALDFGQKLKDEVRQRFGLVCSIGIGPCKFVSKIASDLKKPDALVQVLPDEVQDFLNPLGVEKIPGVGKVGCKKIHDLGVHTIGELREQTRETLQHLFGKWGASLHQYAHGIDKRQIVTHRERKSHSTEKTFDQDVGDIERLHEVLDKQSQRLAALLQRNNEWIRTVTIKARYGDFTTVTRQESFAHAIQDSASILQMAQRLLTRTEAPRRPLRLIGLSVSAFTPSVSAQDELPLFP